MDPKDHADLTPDEEPKDDEHKEPDTELDFEALMADAKSGKMDEDGLQEKLQAYQQAIKEEYEEKNKDSDVEQIAENTRAYFRGNVSLCAFQIVQLAQFSTSDGVRASCAKYVVDHVLEDVNAEGDPVKALLKELTGSK